MKTTGVHHDSTPASSRSSDASRSSVVGAARNCLRVLHAFVGLDREVPLAVLSERTGLNKSTTFRALQTLVAEGFVDQDPESRRYRLGMAAFEVGAEFMRGIELRDVARPVLERLVEQVGETATLAVRDGWEIVFVEKVTARQAVVFFCDIGRRLPLHGGAAAKAILAWLPETQRREYLSRPLTALTPYTVIDATTLEQQLSEVRRAGVSFSNQEVDVGISGVGAPVFGAGGSVVAGLAVAGLTVRFGPERLVELAPAVRQAALEISRQVGCRAVPLAPVNGS